MTSGFSYALLLNFEICVIRRIVVLT